MDIGLDDIRVKLDKLEDKDISMSIIDYLNNQERLKNERDAEISRLNERVNSLLTQNNILYTRAVAENVRPNLPPEIDEEAIIKSFTS